MYDVCTILVIYDILDMILHIQRERERKDSYQTVLLQSPSLPF